MFTDKYIKKSTHTKNIQLYVRVFLLLSMFSYCSSMYSYCCLCIIIVVYVFLLFVHVFLTLSMYSYCCLCILIVLCCLCILIVVYVFLDAATLTEVFPCFFLSCKANARVYLAKTGHGPHSSNIYVLFYVLFVLYRSVYCSCVNVYCTTATGSQPNYS
jgi:hypothetical protein